MSNQQNVQVSTATYGPNNITEMLMNNIVLSRLTDVLDKKFILSFENILKIIILLSVNEIKDTSNSLLKYLLAQIKLAPSLAYQSVITTYQICKELKLSKNRNKDINLESETMSKEYKQVIKLDVEKIFMECLYLYIIKNGNCTYKKELVSIQIKNIKEQILHQRFFDILIKFDNCIIEIINDIEFQTDPKIDYMNDFILSTIPKSYSDLLTEEQKNMIDKCYVKLLEQCQQSEIIDKMMMETEPNYFSEILVGKLISEKYGFDHDKTVIELAILLVILYNHKGLDSIMGKCKGSFRHGISNTLYFDIGPEYDLTKIKNINYLQLAAHVTILRTSLSKYCELIYRSVSREETDCFKCFEPKRQFSQQKQSINIKIKSDLEIDFSSVAQNFVTAVMSLSKKETKKIDIYTISIKKTVTKNVIDNPDYSEWQDNMKLLKEVHNPTIKNNKDSGLEQEIQMSFSSQNRSYMFDQIPPKKITSDIITKEIISTKLNSREKKVLIPCILGKQIRRN